MARIRSIKPEYWIDEKVVELDPWARLLFIGIWNFADDQGFIDDKPKRIKMQIFPGDDIDVVPLLGMLAEAGVLIPYDSPIGPVLHVKNWEKHQRVDKAAQRRFDPASLTIRGALASPREPSPPVLVALAPDLEGKGSGEEGKGSVPPPDGDEATKPKPVRPAKPEPVPGLFDEFYSIFPRKKEPADARRAWDKAIKGGADPEEIVTGAKRYREERHGQEARFTAYPASWLGKAGWLSEPDPPPKQNMQGGHDSRVTSTPDELKEWDQLLREREAS